jgi:hypothetical protein
MLKNFIPLSKGAANMFREMSKTERYSFQERTIAKLMKMQPFHEDVETVVDRVIAEEAERLYKTSEGYRDMMEAKEKFNLDWENRLKTGGPPSVEGADGDPSEQLDKLTRRIMAEKGLDYNAALVEAQLQRKDLTEAIVAQLNAYRHQNDKPGF